MSSAAAWLAGQSRNGRSHGVVMTIEYEVPPFLDWFLRSLVITIPMSLLLLAAAGWLVGFVISATRRGPVEGFYAVAGVIASAVSDLAQFSFRRALAMTLLAVRESLRRRVLIVVAIFLVVLLLAGWYLDVKSDNPARLYLSFVLTASDYLVIALGLFLSAFSLPNDFKNRTIHTIVTKPVRPLEIVVGRILGFMAVGTLVLLVMCVLSYFFVVRGLWHEHRVRGTGASASSPGAAEETVSDQQGLTTTDAHHHHSFTLGPDGTAETDLVMGHRHQVRRLGEGIDSCQVGPPVGMLQSRVPKRGKLRFLDRSGKPAAKGVNVGEEWMYRSYIEGGTLSAAIWTFQGMTADRYPNGFEIEMDIRVFRTFKGTIEQGVRGSIFVKNPNEGAKIRLSEEIPFRAKEFMVDKHFIPRKMKATDRNGVVHDVDVFQDLATDGKLEIMIRCSEPGQYYGMADADLYILEREGRFWWNFVKGFLGIWLQMLLATSFGVMFSTCVSGAVAMMATLCSIVIGFFGSFIVGVATGEIVGGGPVESLIRILTQNNLMSDMEIGPAATRLVRALDFLFMQVMQLTANILPDYRSFSTAAYVAYGYNIDAGLFAMLMLRGFTYFVLVSLVGYFLLKTREVAA